MKNQSNPPHGKPQSITGWRGYITGSGLIFASVAGMRGLFRHEIMCKFPVIVAEQCDFSKYKAKRTKYHCKCRVMIYYQSFQRKYTMIFVVFSWNRLFFCVFR